MANLPKSMGQGAITDTLATLYTCPGSTTAILKHFVVSETAGADRTVRVFVVPSGGTAGTEKAILYDTPVAANDSLDFEGEVVLAAGDTIQIQADDVGLTITASGIEIAPAPALTYNPKRVAMFTIEGVLTTGTGTIRIYNNTGQSFVISEVHIAANTAPTGQSIKVDIHMDGVTIFTDQTHRPEIAAAANEGNTTTIDVATWPDGSYLTMDRDQIGSGVAGSDLAVQVIYS